MISDSEAWSPVDCDRDHCHFRDCAYYGRMHKFCGTHIKGTLNGVVNDTGNDTKQKQKKLEITTTEIQGIQYFIDADGNVYNTYDVHQNKNNPKIIAKYIIDEQGNYKIPSIFDKK